MGLLIALAAFGVPLLLILGFVLSILGSESSNGHLAATRNPWTWFFGVSFSSAPWVN